MTNRKTYKQSERHNLKNKQTARKKDRKIDSGTQTARKRECQNNRQSEKTDRQTDTQSDSQIDRQTGTYKFAFSDTKKIQSQISTSAACVTALFLTSGWAAT